MKWENRLFVAGALFLGLAVAGASADTVDLQSTSISPSVSENVSWDSGAHFTTETVGQFNFAVTNKTGAAAALIPGSTLGAWCIELTQYVDTTKFNTYSVLGPGSYVNPPFANSGLVTAFFNQFYSTSFTQTQAAAFQLDIWELVLDPTSKNLGSGIFQVNTLSTDPVFIQGNNWLSTLNTSTTGPWVVYQLNNSTLQDEIFAVQGGGSGQPTPLPAAFSGGLALLAGLAVFGKLRRKAQA